MADPISVASFALTLTTKATDALNALRERSQRSKDLDIKDQISTLYDIVLELKEVISRLSDENKQLKKQLEHPVEVPELRSVGDTHYYYLGGGTDGPYCQTCYVVNKRLVKLPRSDNWSGGVRRDCPVCRGTFWEVRMQL